MKNRFIVGFCLFIFVGGALVYSFMFSDSTFTPGPRESHSLTGTGDSIKYDYDSQAIFYSYNSKDFFHCTKDGMKFYSSSSLASPKWTKVFSMSSPKLAGDCNTVAVAEERGKTIYVFNETGILYEKTFENPILCFSVNKTGCLSVILQNGDDYEILMFTGTGAQPPSEKWVFSDYNIFPVSGSMSSDGRVLAVSFININGVQAGSEVVFMYLNMDEARGWPDGIFAKRSIPGEYVMNVKFMDNNNLLAFSDAGVYCYGVADKNTVTDKWTVPINNKVDCVSIYGDKMFALAYGDVILNKNGEKPGTVRIYNINGEITGEYCLDGKATYLSAGTGGIIAGVNRNYYVINTKGQLLWTYSAIQDVRQLIFLENNNTILLAGSQNAQVMKRAKAKTPDTKADGLQEVSR